MTSFRQDSLGIHNASMDSTRSDLSINSRNVVVAEEWTVLGKIGEGSFGEVFEVRDIRTKHHYAIKREPVKMRHPQLKHESIMYDVLAGGPGIPQCHWYGQHEEFNCIVLDLLGPSLNQLRQTVIDLPLDVVVELGCQMVSTMEHIHNCGLVFRDVKPDNFLFPASCHLPEPEMVQENSIYKYDRPTCDELFRQWGGIPKLYVVDFGLTSWWRDPNTKVPYPETKKHTKNKTGTARYASLNVHRGKTHARRDDLESLAYLLLDLVLGNLPWTGIQARNSRAGWDRMRRLKEETFMSDLCAGLPRGLLEFVEYTKHLRFAQQPDYDYMRQLLRGSLHDGEFSAPVRSPFGGHTNRRPYNLENPELEHLEADNKTRENGFLARKSNHDDVFAMDDMANALPDHANENKNGSSSSVSSFQKLLTKTRQSQKRVGWNTHKHDQLPWIPVTDWQTIEQPDSNVKPWGEDHPEASWASSAKLPWM
ncbi:hypothetical protein DFQ28_009767 [Apophysomyces sp. BC1034]|nr:hypothetical protein DFQ30_001739 [Apophysomyces sp. BC1015]KAG0194559.1 hypothetical protein DFQ28_009767 [Apophysomyces sp. BC1034]